MPTLSETVDFLKNPDFFGGKLKVASRSIEFTPGDATVRIPPRIASALSYWAGLNISFQYALKAGNSFSVAPIGGATHFIDPSGLKGSTVQAAFFRWLDENHPGQISRSEYDKPGKGIPDIATAAGVPKQFIYYEIKPDNPGGLRDGKDKLDRIDDLFKRILPNRYSPGPGNLIDPLKCIVMNQSCGAGRMTISLLLRIPVPGLILYKFQVEFAVDPGPFIGRAVIALAIVALLEGGVAALEAAANSAATTAAGGAVLGADQAALTAVRIELYHRVVVELGAELPAVGEWAVEQGSEGLEALKRVMGR